MFSDTIMANVYVGFHDQRSCNRILKPPGGGSSNIFGSDAIPDVVPKPSPQRLNKQAGTIQQIIQTETVVPITKHEVDKTVSVQEVAAPAPDVTAVVTQIQELHVQEVKTTKCDATESTESSTLQSSATFKGSSIGDILKQDEVTEEKRTPKSPAQRIPPGGYSSGLW
ncbi:uncharacterized protein LOC143200991 isoform X2 [Rhynchophorus ferrugineus]|uniref:uncharacterized protein LOC143200991 isoform X2 n=1 Tax=Rhynchophorus ferrugineus TaxID=354439 RepID=UPI003FCE1854